VVHVTILLSFQVTVPLTESIADDVGATVADAADVNVDVVLLVDEGHEAEPVAVKLLVANIVTLFVTVRLSAAVTTVSARASGSGTVTVTSTGTSTVTSTTSETTTATATLTAKGTGTVTASASLVLEHVAVADTVTDTVVGDVAPSISVDADALAVDVTYFVDVVVSDAVAATDANAVNVGDDNGVLVRVTVAVDDCVAVAAKLADQCTCCQCSCQY
jgi:hypothetical protein